MSTRTAMKVSSKSFGLFFGTKEIIFNHQSNTATENLVSFEEPT